MLQTMSPAQYFPIGKQLLLFDKMHNCEMRALVGLELGCDYLVGGLKGVGAATVQEIIYGLPEQTPSYLASALANQGPVMVVMAT